MCDIVLHFLSHRDAAPIVKTQKQLDDTDWDNVMHIPVEQYQLELLQVLR
jgi:hypothetical protein